MATCNMALKLILFLMISTFLNLPRAAEAMPPETMENQIRVNIEGNEVHGNNQGNQISVNIVGNKVHGSNIGPNIDSDKTLEITAIPSEDKTFRITAIPSDDKTLEITAIPSEDKTLEITAIPSEDKTFQITAIPSDAPTQLIAEKTAVPTTEPPATTPPIAETTVVSTTELPATTPPIAETTVVSTTEPPECPRDMFLFGPSNGRQCFKYFTDSKRSWTAANQTCRADNLVLAEPNDPTSLIAYLVANYNPDNHVWVGGRGDGSSMRWLRSGAAISNTSPLWLPGAPGSYVTTADNLLLLTKQSTFDSHPTKPYFAVPGAWSYYTLLCELVMN